MTIKEINGRLRSLLADIPDGDFDALCIFEDFIAPREALLTHPENNISEDKCAMAIGAAHKRLEGYPLQYILGTWEFYGLTFKVGEGVLIPRPDTETAVTAALDMVSRLYDGTPLITVDLCSGSGCIAVAMAKEAGDRVKTYAVELSGDAIPYLLDNVRDNKADVTLIRGDISNGHLLDNFVDASGEPVELDLIISNPPYLTEAEMNDLQREVSYEPETALYGGTDGLKFYRIIASLWGERLRHGGGIVLEIGDRQAEDVKKILSDSGFTHIRVIQYAGLDRVVTAIRK